MTTHKNKFYPSINDIYFKNFDIVEDSTGIKHLRGDLYLISHENSNWDDNECMGYYNPVYQTSENAPTQYFLRLEEKFQYIYEREGKYESMFNKNRIPLTEYDCPVGLQELIADLEVITYLYEFMHNVKPDNDFLSIGLTGIINGADDKPIIKILQIKDNEIRSNSQIIDFITEKVDSIYLNTDYPVRVFKTASDFTFYQAENVIMSFEES